jgi:hypothetical protein
MSKSLLELYTDYLISSFGQTTATSLSRLLGGEISHDQVTRFLASPAKTSADLRRVVKLLVRQIESQDGVLILDDSVEEKPYTDENELICLHWDHAKERSVSGINFLMGFYATETISTGLNHFALKSKIYLSALQTAYSELVKLKPQSLTA